MAAVITEGSGILNDELRNWAKHYVIPLCDYINCGQELCYDFKRLRQLSTVIGPKVRGQMSLEKCKVLDLYCLARFESEVQAEEKSIKD